MCNHAIAVPLATLKKEAKLIKKQSKNNISHTEILFIFATGLGFSNYNEMERFFSKTGKMQAKPLSNLDFLELEKIEESIINSLKKSNENITEIRFIRNEIRSRINHDAYNNLNGMDLSTYFAIVPYFNPSIKKIIDKHTWAVNENTLLAYLYLFSSKMNELNLIENETYFNIYKKLIKESGHILSYGNNSFREMGFALVEGNINEIGEGLLFHWIYEFNNKEISMDEVVYKVKQRIEKEKKYRESWASPYQENNIDIMIPLLNNKNNKSLMGVVTEIKNNTSFNLPFILGKLIKPKKFTIFKEDSEYYKLDHNNYLENITLMGCAGSGKTTSALSLVFQSILNNQSVFYIDNKYDTILMYYFNAVAKIANREKDLLFLNDTNIEEFINNKQKVENAINNNKIILFLNKGIYHDDSLLKFNNTINSIANVSLSARKGYGFSHLKIFIDDAPLMNKENMTCLTYNAKKLNGRKVSFVYMGYDFSMRVEDKELYKEFVKTSKYCIIMKQEDPTEIFNYFQMRNVNIKDLRCQNAGEFYLVKNGAFIQNKFLALYCFGGVQHEEKLILNTPV